jgi:ribosome biogenesis GTPase
MIDVEVDRVDNDDLFNQRTRQKAKEQSRTRTIVKSDRSLPPEAKLGVVVTALGPFWMVRLEDTFVVCTVSGTLDAEHTSTLVTVGDDVHILEDGTVNTLGDRSGTIVRVEPRRTLLSRKAAGRAKREQVLVANVDRLAIVMAAVAPDYNKRLIDRYLIAADKGDLEPILVITKMDLIPDEYHNDIREDLSVYSTLGIPVFFVSLTTSVGLPSLTNAIENGRTLLAGPSGVGKSTLINALTNARHAVGAISQKYSKGRHTTTSSTVVPLPGGGAIVDSPGIREFSIWELSLDELPYYFDEFADFTHQCRFIPCSHTHEPGCAVKDAVERGHLDPERYVSYLNLVEELRMPAPSR